MTVAEYNSSVENFADGIYRFILKNMADNDKARDVVQDTFEKLWIKHDEVNAEKAKSYLFTTAYHTMIDMIRKDKRTTSFEFGHEQEHTYEMVYTDAKEILEQAVNRLPDVQRSVVLLRDYEGYSYDEIASITGLSESQVKVYIYRARLSLKNYIGNPEKII